jgi:HSP20 family molecular chaperone IbpA
MFYNGFWNAIVVQEREKLSAKWRRSRRNPKRFDIFRTFTRLRNRNNHATPNSKSLRTKRWSYPHRHKAPKETGSGKLRDPEPLIDIIEGKDEIVVIAEIAGFDMENLRIRVRNQRLILSAETLDRNYYKSLNLPKRVIPNAMHTRYKNGVLEVQLKKTVEEALDKVAG